MSRGQHAAEDGSFPRSAGGAMARGIGLILLAVLLGVVLLRATDRSESANLATDGGDRRPTATTVADDESTTTTEAPAEPRDPAEVAILVANGTGGQVRGAAGRVADVLKGSNYIIKSPTNTRAAAEASMVYFQPGYEADATQVASLLTPAPGVQPMPDPIPVADLAGAHILVVVAADLAAGR